MSATSTLPLTIDWAVAQRPLAGQTVSGDLHLVKTLDHRVLLAVVDGLGHGDQATAAAQAAVKILERYSQETVISLVKRCHTALLKTRGVVMTLALIHPRDGTLTWLGVGNVEARLLRANGSARQARESVLLRSGLVGYQLPVLQTSVAALAAGDILVFATDGINPAFAEGINLSEAPRQIADRIMKKHFKGTDDALVLVARYLGARYG